jgi:hypothetical protein
VMEGELGNQVASCAPLSFSESSLLTFLLVYFNCQGYPC